MKGVKRDNRGWLVDGRVFGTTSESNGYDLIDYSNTEMNSIGVCWPKCPRDRTLRGVYETLQQFALSDEQTVELVDRFSSFERKAIHELVKGFGFHSTGDKKVILVSKEVLSTETPADPLREIIKKFANSKDKELLLKNLSGSDRKYCYLLADQFKLEHESLGQKKNRSVLLRKPDDRKLYEKQQQIVKLRASIQAFKKQASTKNIHHVPSYPLLTVLPVIGNYFRFCNWNIEWMDHWFNEEDSFTRATSEISDVHELCTKVASVIQELDPDLLAVQEGPRNVRRMQMFVEKYLEGKFDIFGGLETNPAVTQQLYFLVKKDGPLSEVSVHQKVDAFLRESWDFDVAGDCTLESYSFTRRPLVIQGTLSTKGTPTRLVACTLHAKSKYISSGKSMWRSKNPEKVAEFVAASVRNRRRIAGEYLRLRKALDALVYEVEDEGPLLLVSGDMNDGPGMDFFEEKYLLGDAVDLLLGSPFQAKKLLHSLLQKNKWVERSEQWSVEFDDYVDDIPGKRVLLDHIFVSDHGHERVVRATVAHSVFNKYVSITETNENSSREKFPSDHRPVYVDLTLDAFPLL